MNGSLIINARARLGWHQRLWSDLSTVLMWGAWLKLWYPVVRSFAWVAGMGAVSNSGLTTLLSSGSTIDVQRYAVALVGTSGTLLLWNRLPTLKAPAPAVHSVCDYARHFALSEGEILTGRGTSVCVVHHDDQGGIIRLEPAGTPAVTPARGGLRGRSQPQVAHASPRSARSPLTQRAPAFARQG
jgi:poly-beta-1,6-N-acetyl-D-glucosamine biosynthesis protein PgaD